MAKRVRRRRVLKSSDLRGVVAGSVASFKRVKDYLSYDPRGNNVLHAYLVKTSRQLRKLPDSEFGDLVSEADKQIWRCASRFVERMDRGEKGKIKFKVYYYQRLKQCMTDRVNATIRPTDLINTHASSLSKMTDEDGYDPPSSNGHVDQVISVDVARILDSLGKREQLIARRLQEGWTVNKIKRELIGRMSERKGRDESEIKKMVNKSIRQALKALQGALDGVWADV